MSGFSLRVGRMRRRVIDLSDGFKILKPEVVIIEGRKGDVLAEGGFFKAWQSGRKNIIYLDIKKRKRDFFLSAWSSICPCSPKLAKPKNEKIIWGE